MSSLQFSQTLSAFSFADSGEVEVRYISSGACPFLLLIFSLNMGYFLWWRPITEVDGFLREIVCQIRPGSSESSDEIFNQDSDPSGNFTDQLLFSAP